MGNNRQVYDVKKRWSKTITFLRFPMIIGIVIIHCYINGAQGFADTVGDKSIAAIISYYLSNVLTRCCVPLYFLISGYLFFNNISVFNTSKYFDKLKSRFRTLLLPYLLWNLIGFFIILLQRSPLLNSFYPGLASKHIDLSFFLDCFWRYGEYNYAFFDNGGMPVDYPLWFIRNIMILCLISPIIYHYVKTLKLFGPLILTALFIGGWWIQLDGFSLTGILFFTWGAYLAQKTKAIQSIFTKGRLAIILWAIFQTIDLFTRFSPDINHYFHALSIIFGVISVIYIGDRCCTKGYVIPNRFAQTAFFIYAFHGLIVHACKIGAIRILHPTTNIQWIGIYFALLFILLFVSISIYYIGKTAAPKFIKLLCGGR